MWLPLAQAESGGLRNTIDSLARTPLSQIVIFVVVCSILRMAIFGYLKNTAPHKRLGFYPVAKFINEAMDAIVYAGVFVFMIIRPFFIQAFLIPSGSMLQTLHLNDFIVANKAIYRYTEPKLGDIVVFKPPKFVLDQGQDDQDYIKRLQGTPGDFVEIKSGVLYRNGTRVNEPYLSDSLDNDHQLTAGPETLMRGNSSTADAIDWKLIQYKGKARPDLYDQYIPVISLYGESNFGSECTIARKFAVGYIDDPRNIHSYPMAWKAKSELTPDEIAFENELKAAPAVKIPKGFYLFMGDNRNHSYDGRCWGLVPRDEIVGRSEFIWLPLNRWRITR